MCFIELNIFETFFEKIKIIGFILVIPKYIKILKNSLVSINSFTKKKHEDKYNKIGQKASTLLGEHYKNNHIKNKIGKNTYEENQKKNIKFIDEELNEMNYNDRKIKKSN